MSTARCPACSPCLDTLATSTSLSRGDLATFHARALAALGPREAYVLLLDTDLQQLVNTRRPFGTALPKTSDRATAEIVLKTHSFQFSNSFVGAVSGQRVVNVLRPVIENGKVRYILIVTVGTHRFGPILKAGIGRKEYAILLLDGNDEVIAKVLPEGQSPAELSAMDHAKAQQGLSIRSIAGEPWIEATQKSQLTGWRTVVRVPRATLDGPLWRSLYLLGLAALITIAAAVAVIAFATRVVSTSMSAIQDATRRLAANQPLPATAPAVIEAAEIMGELRYASDLVKARTDRLRESEARYGAAMRIGKMGSWEVDFAKRTRTWSPEAVTLFDLRRPLGIVGGPDDELVAAMHPDDRHLLASYHEHLLTHDELDAEYRIVLRDGTVRYVAGRAFVISRQPNGAPHVLINVAADVTERANAEQHLSEFTNILANSRARFEALVEAAAQVVWSASPSGMIVEDSPSWRAYTGQSQEEFLGAGWLDALHPEDRDRTRKAWRKAVEEQQTYQIDYRLQHFAGGYRWTRARGVPIRTVDGTVAEWVGMNEDIDEQVQRTEQLSIVNRELAHRTKNLLAIIQSIARRTFTDEQGASKFVGSFLDRLHGLALSHDLLVHGNWSGVSLEDLVREHLRPFVGANDNAANIEGPELKITPAAAQNLGLAFHELATNAAKYGALKDGADEDGAGKLHIHWSFSHNEKGEMLDFHWSEDVATKGSPDGNGDGDGGFGTQILNRIVAVSLNGTADYRVTDKGVDWHLIAPIDRLSHPLETDANLVEERREIASSDTHPG